MHRIEETLERGICIGCGACSVATRGSIPIKLGTPRMYQADLQDVNESDRRIGSKVCPFSDESPSETELGAPHAGEEIPHHPKLGQAISIFAGRVRDSEYLLGSSSGGLTSWMVTRLIQEGTADAVIKVGSPGPSDNEIFGYSIINGNASQESRKSHYYATTMVEALSQIETDNRRFIIVGVPCFIRAARSLCITRPELGKKLVFFVALVCGHYKTQAFAESLAWQVGVHPNNLQNVDFRVKNQNRPSSDYDFAAQDATTGEWSLAQTKSLVGGNWGYNAFQPEACNFCDDVVGETADVSFGDAWLPQYKTEPLGTNIVISRNPLVEKLLQDGVKEKELTLDILSEDDAILSQAGGFRHRREGLAVRLADDLLAGKSVPKKRVLPNLRVVSPRRRKLIRHRRKMAEQSHILFEESRRLDDLSIFIKGTQHEISVYQKIDATRMKTVLLSIKIKLNKILHKVDDFKRSR